MSWATGASYLAVQGDAMFATRDKTISKINVATGENTPFLTLAEPKGLAIWRKWLFVVDAATLLRVNLRNKRTYVVATLDRPTAICCAGGVLYIVTAGTTITQLNPLTLQQSQFITGLTDATDLAVNATDMYVTSPTLVSKISLADQTVTTIPFPRQSQLKGVAIHNNFVYVANYGLGAIAQIHDAVDNRWQLLDAVGPLAVQEPYLYTTVLPRVELPVKRTFHYALAELTASRKYTNSDATTKVHSFYQALANLYDGARVVGTIETYNTNVAVSPALTSVSTKTIFTLFEQLSTASARFTFLSRNTDVLTNSTTAEAVSCSGLFVSLPTITIAPTSTLRYVTLESPFNEVRHTPIPKAIHSIDDRQSVRSVYPFALKNATDAPVMTSYKVGMLPNLLAHNIDAYVFTMNLLFDFTEMRLDGEQPITNDVFHTLRGEWRAHFVFDSTWDTRVLPPCPFSPTSNGTTTFTVRHTGADPFIVLDITLAPKTYVVFDFQLAFGVIYPAAKVHLADFNFSVLRM